MTGLMRRLSATLVLMMREEGADRLETAVEPLPPRAVAPDRPAEPQARTEAQAPASPSRAPQSRAQLPATDIAPPAPQAAPQIEQKVLAGNAVPAESPPEPRREVAAMSETARPMMSAAPATADAAAGRIARSAPAAAAVASAPPPLWKDLIDQPADKWIQRILEWQRAGRSADAEALVREFVRRFPQQPLPPEIRQP